MKKLTATIASMATKLNCKNINPNSGDSGGSKRDSRRPQMKKLRNMEAHMVFIQLESTTTSQPATTKSPSTRLKLHGVTYSGTTCFGPTPSALQWNNIITPTDINRGLQA